MSSGKQLLRDSLRGPLTEIGWQPRARGWFTRDLGGGHLGVLAESVASAHAPAGGGEVSLHVGLRVEQVERVVEAITGRSGSYRDRTAVTSLGQVSPEARWISWTIDGESSEGVARELARRVAAYAVPYLRELSANSAALIEAARSSAAFAQSTGRCRVAILTAQSKGSLEAIDFLDQLEAKLGDHTDAAAADNREIATRIRNWIIRSG